RTVALVGRQPLADSAANGTREYTWAADRLPARAEFAWQAHRPEAIVEGVVDLHLTERSGRVRHRLAFRPVDGASLLPVQVRAVWAGRVRVVEGGRLEQADKETGRGVLVFDVSGVGKPPAVTLEYTFPMDASAEQAGLAVPLVQPVGTVRGETQVRVWTDPGL